MKVSKGTCTLYMYCTCVHVHDSKNALVHVLKQFCQHDQYYTLPSIFHRFAYIICTSGTSQEPALEICGFDMILDNWTANDMPSVATLP